jgi:hypothetical protein
MVEVGVVVGRCVYRRKQRMVCMGALRAVEEVLRLWHFTCASIYHMVLHINIITLYHKPRSNTQHITWYLETFQSIVIVTCICRTCGRLPGSSASFTSLHSSQRSNNLLQAPGTRPEAN